MKSHRNVTPRQEALAERNLYTALAALQSAEECRAFLRDLCTPAEIQAMSDRWSVVEFLQRGVGALEDFLEGFPTVSRELAIQALEEAKVLLLARA